MFIFSMLFFQNSRIFFFATHTSFKRVKVNKKKMKMLNATFCRKMVLAAERCGQGMVGTGHNGSCMYVRVYIYR